MIPPTNNWRQRRTENSIMYITIISNIMHCQWHFFISCCLFLNIKQFANFKVFQNCVIISTIGGCTIIFGRCIIGKFTGPPIGLFCGIGIRGQNDWSVLSRKRGLIPYESNILYKWARISGVKPFRWRVKMKTFSVIIEWKTYVMR